MLIFSEFVVDCCVQAIALECTAQAMMSVTAMFTLARHVARTAHASAAQSDRIRILTPPLHRLFTWYPGKESTGV
jgi:hypothetical protein